MVHKVNYEFWEVKSNILYFPCNVDGLIMVEIASAYSQVIARQAIFNVSVLLFPLEKL